MKTMEVGIGVIAKRDQGYIMTDFEMLGRRITDVRPVMAIPRVEPVAFVERKDLPVFHIVI